MAYKVQGMVSLAPCLSLSLDTLPLIHSPNLLAFFLFL